MPEVVEMRPAVVVDRTEQQNRLVALGWDDEKEAWIANDGTTYRGNGPESDPNPLVVEVEPDPVVSPSRLSGNGLFGGE